MGSMIRVDFVGYRPMRPCLLRMRLRLLESQSVPSSMLEMQAHRQVCSYLRAKRPAAPLSELEAAQVRVSALSRETEEVQT